MTATSCGFFNIFAMQEKTAEIFNINIFEYELQQKLNMMMDPF